MSVDHMSWIVKLLQLSEHEKLRKFKLKTNPMLSARYYDIEVYDLPQQNIVLNQQGLQGVSSPLPSYFQLLTIAERPGATFLNELCDLFNHHYYHFEYQWIKQLYMLVATHCWGSSSADLCSTDPLNAGASTPTSYKVEDSQRTNQYIKQIQTVHDNGHMMQRQTELQQIHHYVATMVAPWHIRSQLLGVFNKNLLQVSIALDELVPKYVATTVESLGCRYYLAHNSNLAATSLLTYGAIRIALTCYDLDSWQQALVKQNMLMQQAQACLGSAQSIQLCISLQNYAEGEQRCLGEEQFQLGYSSLVGHNCQAVHYYEYPRK